MYENAININLMSQLNKFSREPADNQKLQIFNCSYHQIELEGDGEGFEGGRDFKSKLMAVEILIELQDSVECVVGLKWP